MSKKRKSIGHKVRFEVFKRDSFTCQYCGRKSPDVVLRIDHINPVANGGSDEMLNLITACLDCNSGKSDRLLSDDQSIQKQRAQLEVLQERRTQLAMMMEWQQELLKQDDELSAFWSNQWKIIYGASQFEPAERGRKILLNLFKRYGAELLTEAMKAAVDRKPSTETSASWENCFGLIQKQCHWIKSRTENPELCKLKYITGIIKNRF